MKKLVINADDANLTEGVTQGILKAHDQGIITSTTVLINLPLKARTVEALLKRPRLGLGLHLNVTHGEPVNLPVNVPSLVTSEGRFRRPSDYLKRGPDPEDVFREYEAQLRLFERDFDRLPDHLDTHHHLHDHPVFFRALAKAARRYGLPVRRSRLFGLSKWRRETHGLKTTDFLFGSLDAQSFWQEKSFLGVVENLPEGTSEIACHPGFCDASLRRVSSFQEARERELDLFSSPKTRNSLTGLNIHLTDFK